jgi:hypothetical protein
MRLIGERLKPYTRGSRKYFFRIPADIFGGFRKKSGDTNNNSATTPNIRR